MLQLQRQAGNRAVVQLLRQPAGPHGTAVQRAPGPGDPAKDPGDPGKARPAWMDKANLDPLPGEPAPGYEDPRFQRPWMPIQIPPFTGTHIYTEADRERLRKALLLRERENVRAVGRFLNQYISTVITITGRYVSAEMREAANTPGRGTFLKLLKFVAGEVAEALVKGSVGVFLVGKLAQGTLKALEFFGEKSMAYAWNDISGADDKTLQDAKLDETQALLDRMITQVGRSTGDFTEGMVNSLGGGENINRAFWLGGAPLNELWRFRVPEAFPAVDAAALRAVVAGVIAAKAHTGGERTKYDCWGLQCAGDTYHRHEIVLGARPTRQGATLTMAQLNSSSKVLSEALAGASVRMLPNMAVHLAVEATPNLGGSTRLMDAFRAPGQATIDEISDFTSAFPGAGNRGATLVRRDPTGKISVSGGGVDEAMWYYQLATGDNDLSRLSSEVVDWQTTAQESTSDVEGESTTRAADPAGLAQLAQWRMAAFRDAGGRTLIEEILADAKPLPATGKWSKGRSLVEYETTRIDY